MVNTQPLEQKIEVAIAQAPQSARELAQQAAAHRRDHPQRDTVDTRRHWVTSAQTYCYETHIAISGQAEERLAWLAEVFYHAAILRSHPWYPQFLGGDAAPLSRAPAAGIAQHQLCVGEFDLGVGAPRWYRQLVSLAAPGIHVRVIVASSVDDPAAPPVKGRLAYTLQPNGEVLYHDGDCLHWHHICCTPGAAVLPPRLDRLLINVLRVCSLDGAERRTYREEAEQLRDWLQGADTIDALSNDLYYTHQLLL